MTSLSSVFRCHGCGTRVDGVDAPPFRCPRYGRGDADHVLVRELIGSVPALPPPGVEPNPFLRFRDLLHLRHRIRATGGDEAELDALVRELDGAVAALDRTSFHETPFARSVTLSDALGFDETGGVWVKNETRNVAGSHKARHLFGVILDLEARFRAGQLTERRPLAIASCGNAALAAGVMARAAGWPLEVYVPEDADALTVARLRDLEARVVPCPRTPDDTGDPCVRAFRAAVARGALPFTCQGSENGLAVEGGHTLGWEIAAACAVEGLAIDRVFVQVGGGALASAVAASFAEAVAAGALPYRPRLYTVQTRSAYPLRRAHALVCRRIHESGETPESALAYAAAHRPEMMWPWETLPVSRAEGILDDETYDWLEVVRAMIETNGRSLVVDEATLERANSMARDMAGFPAGFTGSAGLAGVLALPEDDPLRPDERVVVLMTGIRRSGGG